MSNDLRVTPTPIQRNSSDVALELTLFYYQIKPIDTVEEMQKTYTDFYMLAEGLRTTHYSELKEALPQAIKIKLKA